VTCLTTCGGFAVLVSWTTLLVGGQWRTESKWADRLGRAMGFGWILAAFAVAIGNVLIETGYLVHPAEARAEVERVDILTPVGVVLDTKTGRSLCPPASCTRPSASGATSTSAPSIRMAR